MDVELRHLRAFQVLAEELNFTRAAARLHITQQALSGQIRDLESRIGAPLFYRTTRTVDVTDAGRTLLTHVPGVLSAVAQALDETRQTVQGLRGALVVGLGGVAGLDLTPRILRAYTKAMPNVTLHVKSIEFSDPSAGLASGSVDVALAWLPVPAGIAAAPLLEDERTAVLAADHPLASAAAIWACDLAREPFVWIETMDESARDFWTLAKHRQGQPPRIGATITGFEDMLAAIRSGQAVSASPAALVRSLPWADVVTRPLLGAEPATLAVCRVATCNKPIVEAFIQTALKVSKEPPGGPPGVTRSDSAVDQQ